MKALDFNQEQITNILEEVAQKQDGYNHLMQLALEALMRAERDSHNRKQGDVSNGFRSRRIFGHGKILELKVPRSRYEHFYPVLLSILRDQEAEAHRLAFSLYGKGLTSEQVGDLFEELYGHHYSKAAVSQMMDYAREEVEGWLQRPLESYYPVVYVDATFVPTRRDQQVSKEAYYTVLGVLPDRRREVLAIINQPVESAGGWQEVLEQIQARGVQQIGLLVSDDIRGLDNALASVFSGTPHQLCVTHLQRNVTRKLKQEDKHQVIEQLKEVFPTSLPKDSPEQGWQRWISFCRRWEKKYPRFKNMQDPAKYYNYFTYLNYHYRVRPMIYTTNWIERLNRDYKRVLKMRGALPNPEAVILLMGRVAMTRTAYQRKVPSLDYEQNKFSWLDDSS